MQFLFLGMVLGAFLCLLFQALKGLVEKMKNKAQPKVALESLMGGC
jgi:hypothetical protein